MTMPKSDTAAAANPIVRRPILFGVILFFVQLGAQWSLDHVRAIAAGTSTLGDVDGILVGAVCGSVACVLLVRRLSRIPV